MFKKLLLNVENELREMAGESNKWLAAFGVLALAVLIPGSAHAALDTAVTSQISTAVSGVISDVNTVFAIVVGLTLAVVGIRWVMKMIKSG